MALYRPLPFVQHLLTKHLSPSSYVIDATLGNGFDTDFITNILTRTGHLWGFDIQQQALDITTQKIAHKPCQKDLFCQSHTQMLPLLSAYQQKIDLIIFNLGFLPHSDETITTTFNSTYRALLQSISLLRKKGLIIIVAYPGHAVGFDEHIKLSQLLQQQAPDHFFISTYQQINAQRQVPIVYTIEKL